MEDQGGQQVACHPAAGGGDVQQPNPGGSQVGGCGGRQDGVEGQHRGGEAPGERVDGGEQEPASWPVLWSRVSPKDFFFNFALFLDQSCQIMYRYTTKKSNL